MEQGLNPVLRVLLEGAYDNGSPFAKLRGTPHILQIIWEYITSYWKSLIKIGAKRAKKPRGMEPGAIKIVPQDKFVIKLEKVTFPTPQDININMMPFVMGRDFETCRLPKYLHSYWESLIKPLLTSYNANAELEEGKICFLTIQESHVSCNQTQRRPGLHTDNPGTFMIEEQGSSSQETISFKETGYGGKGSSSVRFYEHHWGCGVNLRRHKVQGGIYMASNVENSCAVWNSQVQCDENNDNMEIIRKHGDIEYFRPYLGHRTVMEPNKIYWITDRTPHESLPLKNDAYRQYFRLVTHQVSLWFDDHSTKNPLGLLPDPNITKIVKGSKFGNPGQLRVISNFQQDVPI